MKGVIGDEHVSARLLLAARKVALFVVTNLLHRRRQPTLVRCHHLRHVDFDYYHARVRRPFAKRLVQLVRNAQPLHVIDICGVGYASSTFPGLHLDGEALAGLGIEPDNGELASGCLVERPIGLKLYVLPYGKLVL